MSADTETAVIATGARSFDRIVATAALMITGLMTSSVVVPASSV